MNVKMFGVQRFELALHLIQRMLCVKTTRRQSSIHGIGIFADEKIPEGTAIWKFVDGFDQIFTAEDIKRLPYVAQAFLARHAYKSNRTGRYILDTDDGRYYNHSNTPNSKTISVPGEIEDVIIATKTIESGEEITINYGDQESDMSKANALWNLYENLELADEVDPRVKSSVQSQV